VQETTEILVMVAAVVVQAVLALLQVMSQLHLETQLLLLLVLVELLDKERV
jgi:hypothetical protein